MNSVNMSYELFCKIAQHVSSFSTLACLKQTCRAAREAVNDMHPYMEHSIKVPVVYAMNNMGRDIQGPMYNILPWRSDLFIGTLENKQTLAVGYKISGEVLKSLTSIPKATRQCAHTLTLGSPEDLVIYSNKQWWSMSVHTYSSNGCLFDDESIHYLLCPHENLIVARCREVLEGFDVDCNNICRAFSLLIDGYKVRVLRSGTPVSISEAVQLLHKSRMQVNVFDDIIRSINEYQVFDTPIFKYRDLLTRRLNEIDIIWHLSTCRSFKYRYDGMHKIVINGDWAADSRVGYLMTKHDVQSYTIEGLVESFLDAIGCHVKECRCCMCILLYSDMPGYT